MEPRRTAATTARLIDDSPLVTMLLLEPLPSGVEPARDRLIAATARLISTGGPQAATSRAIADAAGENLAAITYYFRTLANC